MSSSAEAKGIRAAAAFKRHSTLIVVGAIIGVLSGGFFGLFFGGFLGLMLSRYLAKTLRKYSPQQAIFKATFSVMGKLAKADGRVSENEIAYARAVMAQMRLSEAKTQEAIELFTEGKSDDFDIAEVLRPLEIALRRRPDVKIVFLEIQLQAAMADGEVSPAELALIKEVCRLLALTEQEIAVLISRAKAQRSFHDEGGFVSPQAKLDDAYKVIGVEPEATDAEVKRAYRKLMSQHHPDKLVAKGLPEEMMQVAKEKSQEIQAAYELIKQSRKS